MVSSTFRLHICIKLSLGLRFIFQVGHASHLFCLNGWQFLSLIFLKYVRKAARADLALLMHRSASSPVSPSAETMFPRYTNWSTLSLCLLMQIITLGIPIIVELLEKRCHGPRKSSSYQCSMKNATDGKNEYYLWQIANGLAFRFLWGFTSLQFVTFCTLICRSEGNSY